MAVTLAHRLCVTAASRLGRDHSGLVNLLDDRSRRMMRRREHKGHEPNSQG
jgi:hypothetical protein